MFSEVSELFVPVYGTLQPEDGIPEWSGGVGQTTETECGSSSPSPSTWATKHIPNPDYQLRETLRPNQKHTNDKQTEDEGSLGHTFIFSFPISFAGVSCSQMACLFFF